MVFTTAGLRAAGQWILNCGFRVGPVQGECRRRFAAEQSSCDFVRFFTFLTARATMLTFSQEVNTRCVSIN